MNGLPRRAALALGGVLFCCFMLLGSRERPWSDGHPIFDVAVSIVQRGTFAIPTRWPATLPLGPDGRIYASSPLLQSLVHVPGAALEQALLGLSPRRAPLWRALVCHLAPAALVALALVLFVDLALRLGISRRVAFASAAGLAFGSIALVYARSPYGEALQLACFTGLFRALWLALGTPRRGTAAALGVWAALLVDAKLVYAVAVLGAAGVLAVGLRRDRAALARVGAWAALAGAPIFALVPFYNHARWGSALAIAKGTDGTAFLGEWTIVGLWGYLFSPGKSVFLYSPVLVLSLFGMPALWRRHRRVALMLLATVAPVVLFCARVLFWAGDWSWGPRYLVFSTAALALPAALALEGWWAARRRGALGAAGALLTAGVIVQAAGCAFAWDAFIRIAHEARAQWLGTPNLAGTKFEVETMFDLHWLPAFQPIAGHLWLARHVAAGDSWQTAEAAAPWHRYTTLPLDISSTYPRARFDFWALDYRGDVGAGLALGALWALGLAGSAWGLRRGLRAAAAPG